MQIVSLAQAQPTWTGWKAFENDRNRHALATALTDNTSELFRDMWYNYHRKGLDEMAANPDRGTYDYNRFASGFGTGEKCPADITVASDVRRFQVG